MKLTKKQLQNLLIEQVLFSEGLRYHVENSIPLYDSIYRPGSKGFFSLISESRKMYNNGLLRVDEDELDMLNSDLGEFAIYEGREVALDFPISESADLELMNEHFAGSSFSDSIGRSFSVEDVVAYAQQNHDRYFCPNFPVSKIEHDLSWWQGDEQRMMRADTSFPLLVLIEDGVLSVADGLNRLYKAVNVEGKRSIDVYLVPKEDIMHFAQTGRLDEKKSRKSNKSSGGSQYKGRKVKLNKPARNTGSGGKFVVYVRNPKTGNIKRITFGARGMTTGLRNPARRKSFAARHRCEQKKDKLASGYWACRIGRYPTVSGAPYTTWW